MSGEAEDKPWWTHYTATSGGSSWPSPSWVAWLVDPFVFTSVYLLAVGAETAIAAERHEAGGSD